MVYSQSTTPRRREKNLFYADEWTVDSPENRTYQPKLSPKWISKDGREMVLIWSDAQKDEKGRSHTVNYRCNPMRTNLRPASGDE